MPTFPRTVLPQEVSWPEMPTGMKAFSESGKGQVRSIGQVGRVWTETYPPLKLTDSTNRSWLAQVEDYWRNVTLLDVDHRSLRTLLGVGGGTPSVSSPAALNIASSNNNTILIATTANHGFAVGDQVQIAAHTRSPSINGLHTVTAVPSPDTFEIPSVLGAFVSGGSGTGTVRKTITGASITTRNWPVSTANVLRAGDVIRFAGVNIVHTVTADVSSDGIGDAVMAINPPVYAGTGLVDLDTIVTNQIAGSVLFRAIIDDMNVPRGRGLDIYAGLTITFREMPGGS